MLWLKSCPRCHGDLYDNSDIYGESIDSFHLRQYFTRL